MIRFRRHLTNVLAGNSSSWLWSKMSECRRSSDRSSSHPLVLANSLPNVIRVHPASSCCVAWAFDHSALVISLRDSGNDAVLSVCVGA